MTIATKARRKAAPKYDPRLARLEARAAALPLIDRLPDDAEIGVPEFSLMRGTSDEVTSQDLRLGKLRIPESPTTGKRRMSFHLGAVRKVLRGETA